MESLERFVKAQECIYSTALKELKDGLKKSHYMWYIFPQLRGLGNSHKSFIYGIVDIKEAKDYLAHPLLSSRLRECCEILLGHKDKAAEEILGDIDAKKLRSSMTLFALISEEDSLFHKVLDAFFDSKKDEKTISLLCENKGFHIINGELSDYFGEDEDSITPSEVI